MNTLEKVPSKKRTFQVCEQEPPLTPLLNELHTLKKELKRIKAPSYTEQSIDERSELGDRTIQKTSSTIMDEDMLRIELPVWCEWKQKCNSNLVQVWRSMKKCGSSKLLKRFNRFMESINHALRSLEKSGGNNTSNRSILWANNNLEKYIIELKQNLAYKTSTQSITLDTLSSLQNQLQYLHGQLKKQLEAHDSNREIMEHLRMEREGYEKKLKVYEVRVEKKQQELFTMEEQVKYNRNEWEKMVEQVKHLEEVWEKERALWEKEKDTLKGELEKVQREKDQWKTECESRRNQNSQIHHHLEQNILLQNHLHNLRQNLSETTVQLSSHKATQNLQQKQIIELEEQNGRLGIQNEKLSKSVQIFRQEIGSLVREVQLLRKEGDRMRGRKKKAANDKTSVFESIKQMIKQHRNDTT